MEDFLKDKANQYKITPKESTWAGIESVLIQKRRKRAAWMLFFGSMLVVGALTVFMVNQEAGDWSQQAGDSRQEAGDSRREAESPGARDTTVGKSTYPQAQADEIGISGNQEIRKSKNQQTPSAVTKGVLKYDWTWENASTNDSMKSKENWPDNGEKPEIVMVVKDTTNHSPNVAQHGEKIDTSKIEMPRQGPIVKDERKRKVGIDSTPQQIKPVDSALVETISPSDTAQFSRIIMPPVAAFAPRWSINLIYAYGTSFYNSSPRKESNVASSQSSFSGWRTAPNEFPGPAYSIDLSLSRILYDSPKNQFYVGAGIRHKRISWKGEVGAPASYTLKNDGTRVIADSVSTSSSGIKELVTVELNSADEGYNEGDYSFTSHASFISVPIHVGYRRLLRPSFGVSTDISYAVNYVNDFSLLQYHNALNTYVARNDPTEEIKSWSSSAAARIGLFYKLNPRMTIGLGGEYQRFVRPIQTFMDSSPADRKPYSTMGTLGINFAF